MIALIFCGDLKYCPYIKRYTERIEKMDIDYCVLFWNRSEVQMDLPQNYFSFDCLSSLNGGKSRKAFHFLKFRKWIINKLKELNVNKIIALSTLTGVLLGKELYKKEIPYIFDIRDYSYEHIPFFYWIEKKIIEKSVFTAISSKGYVEFLPKHDYIIAHNFNRNDIKNGKKFVKHEKPITFVWNGVVRYFEHQKQYLDALKNDERFKIVFHGSGPQLDLYREYCQDNGFNNTLFTGSYNNSDKEKLIENAGILNNSYGYIKNSGNKLKYAVSNRFYDGIIYHIPQIVEPVGFKTQWVKNTSVGENFVVDRDFADRLYDYYTNIDEEKFNEACNIVLHDVICEDEKYVAVIDDFIKL